ncbi:MAG: hypothetical protein ACRD98_01190 [Nitrososphaera sp.]
MTLPPEQADKEVLTAEIDGLIEQITKDCSKPYFGMRLKQLARENFENAEIICNYILAEKAAYSIMVSTKEGKMKNLGLAISALFERQVVQKPDKEGHSSLLGQARKGRRRGPEAQLERNVQRQTNDISEILQVAIQP